MDIENFQAIIRRAGTFKSCIIVTFSRDSSGVEDLTPWPVALTGKEISKATNFKKFIGKVQDSSPWQIIPEGELCLQRLHQPLINIKEIVGIMEIMRAVEINDSINDLQETLYHLLRALQYSLDYLEIKQEW